MRSHAGNEKCNLLEKCFHERAFIPEVLLRRKRRAYAQPSLWGIHGARLEKPFFHAGEKRERARNVSFLGGALAFFLGKYV